MQTLFLLSVFAASVGLSNGKVCSGSVASVGSNLIIPVASENLSSGRWCSNPETCTYNVRRSGRCAGFPVRWTEMKGYHELSPDVAVHQNVNADQCRQKCFENEQCQSADFVNNVCYLNSGTTKLEADPNLTIFFFECCTECSSTVRSGGRCAGDRVRWTEFKGFHELTPDVDVIRGVNVEQCRQKCLENAKCESIDFENNNCYLNGGTSIINANPNVNLYKFECCSSGCTSTVRTAGRCAGRRVHWTLVNGFHEMTPDVDVQRGLNIETCLQKCLENPRCESVDFVNSDCYLNGGTTKLEADPNLKLYLFHCC